MWLCGAESSEARVGEQQLCLPAFLPRDASAAPGGAEASGQTAEFLQLFTFIEKL